MNNIEILFLNEYKSLDNLCKDLLSSQKGISSYIEAMEFYNRKGATMVPAWLSYYRSLKHVRWLRNKIAHENAETECEQQDIDFIVNFHTSILKQQDPLALLNKKLNIHKPSYYVSENSNINNLLKNTSIPSQEIKLILLFFLVLILLVGFYLSSIY